MTAMNDELYGRVKAFVVEHAIWASEEELTPDTRILHDLGIDGDDGDELLEAFCEEFEIQNMSEIDYSAYFGPEGGGLFFFLYYLVFKRDKFLLVPITLRDLVKSAEAKRWIPPQNEPKSGWW